MIEILFEDNHLIIINKKPGDLTQGDKTNDQTLGDKVKNYLKKKYNKPGEAFLGITHRLDRPTSGVIIFTKTSKALSRMNEMFKKNEINKIYWAIVKLVVDKTSGRLEDYLTKNPKQNKSYVTNSLNKKAKKAILYYESILNLDNYSLLKIKLETGRHHQIRTQLSKIGMSIKGDLKYGFPRPNSNGSIHLHSRKTTFIHPVTKKEVIIIAPPPIDKIWDMCLKMLE